MLIVIEGMNLWGFLKPHYEPGMEIFSVDRKVCQWLAGWLKKQTALPGELVLICPTAQGCANSKCSWCLWSGRSQPLVRKGWGAFISLPQDKLIVSAAFPHDHWCPQPPYMCNAISLDTAQTRSCHCLMQWHCLLSSTSCTLVGTSEDHLILFL